MVLELLNEKVIYPICLNSDIESEEFINGQILKKISEIDKKNIFGTSIQNNKTIVVDNEKFNKIGCFFGKNNNETTHILILNGYNPFILIRINFAIRLLFGGNSGFQKFIDESRPCICGDTFSPNCKHLLNPTILNKKDIKNLNNLYEKILELTYKETNVFGNSDKIFYILERFYYVTSGENILFEDRFNNLVSILEKILVKGNEPKSKAIAIRVSKILNEQKLEEYLNKTVYSIRSSITHNLRNSKMNSDISKAECISNDPPIIKLTLYPNCEELKKLIEIVRKIILYYIENIETFDLDKIAVIPQKTLICKNCNSTNFETVWQ